MDYVPKTKEKLLISWGMFILSINVVAIILVVAVVNDIIWFVGAEGICLAS